MFAISAIAARTATIALCIWRSLTSALTARSCLPFHGLCRPELSLDELSLYRFTLDRVFNARFGLHERGNTALIWGLSR